MPTLNGDSMLTINQKHGLPDTIQRSGVLSSAWEHEEPKDTLTDPSIQSDRISPVYSIDIQSEAEFCLAGTAMGSLNMYSIRHKEGSLIHSFTSAHTSAISVVQLSPGEREVITGSWDKCVKFWSLETGKIIREFEGLYFLTKAANSQITSAAFCSSTAYNNPSMLLSTSFDGTIFLYDIRSSDSVRKFPVLDGPKWALSACWGMNGDKIYCGRRNGGIDEYDLKSGNIRKIMNPPGSGAVSVVKMMPNDRHLICCSFDNIR